jgi:hypothetical protein
MSVYIYGTRRSIAPVTTPTVTQCPYEIKPIPQFRLLFPQYIFNNTFQPTPVCQIFIHNSAMIYVSISYFSCVPG